MKDDELLCECGQIFNDVWPDMQDKLVKMCPFCHRSGRYKVWIRYGEVYEGKKIRKTI